MEQHSPESVPTFAPNPTPDLKVVKRIKRVGAALLLALALLIGSLCWLTYRAVWEQQSEQQLISAIKSHDSVAVIALLNAGVDPNTRDHSKHPSVGISRLLWARWTGKSRASANDPTALALVFDWAQVLNDHRPPIIPERPADIAITQALVTKGANVNGRMANGWPVLLGPIRCGYENCAHCLLDHGADPNAATDNGFTALMLASENQSAPMVRMLLAKGAKLDARFEGVTALRYASLSPNPVNRQILLKAGAKE
jgi:ankyrin repeat protein